MKATSPMATARTSKQEQVTRMRIKVVAERSPALLVLIVLMSWGMPINVPVTNPIQLMISESSTFQLLCMRSKTAQTGAVPWPKRIANRHRDQFPVQGSAVNHSHLVPPQLRRKGQVQPCVFYHNAGQGTIGCH